MSSSRGNWAFRSALLLLIAIFATTIWQRDQIRARYWAWRLTSSNDLQTEGYYLACLSGLGSDASGAVHGLAQSDRVDIRSLAIYALQRMPDDIGVADLGRLLADPDDLVRESAATALAFMNRSAATAALSQASRSENPREASAAASALSRVSSPDAHHALCDAAKNHRDSLVRAQAVESLMDLLVTDHPANSTSSPSPNCDPLDAIIAALDDTAPFTGRLALERQRASAERIVIGRTTTRPAAPDPDSARQVCQIAAACLSDLTQQTLNWRDQPRANLASRCRAWIAVRPKL